MSDAATTPVVSHKSFDYRSYLARYSTLIALLALIAFNVIFTKHFISLQTLNVNLTQVATIVIVGVGMTLVIATGGIDLSVGSLMAISAVSTVSGVPVSVAWADRRLMAPSRSRPLVLMVAAR